MLYIMDIKEMMLELYPYLRFIDLQPRIHASPLQCHNVTM